MEIRDYNGEGAWSGKAIQDRYLKLATEMGHDILRALTPKEHVDNNIRWVYPVLESVIEGVKAGDPACIEIGVQFIEHGGKQPFGRILHSNTARALRRATLTENQISRLRTRILHMLVGGDVPHEYHEYVKLLRRIGVGSGWPDILTKIDRSNPYVMRHVDYLEKCKPKS